MPCTKVLYNCCRSCAGRFTLPEIDASDLISRNSIVTAIIALVCYVRVCVRARVRACACSCACMPNGNTRLACADVGNGPGRHVSNA